MWLLENHSDVLTAEQLYDQAEELREKARYREAIATYQKALKALGNRDLLGRLRIQKGMADCYRMVGDFEAAERFYREALRAAERLGDDLERADCLVGIGLSQRARGMLDEAQDNFQRALWDFFKKSKSSLVEGPFRLKECHFRLYRYLIEGGDERELEEIGRTYRQLGSRFLLFKPSLH